MILDRNILQGTDPCSLVTANRLLILLSPNVILHPATPYVFRVWWTSSRYYEADLQSARGNGGRRWLEGRDRLSGAATAYLFRLGRFHPGGVHFSQDHPQPPIHPTDLQEPDHTGRALIQQQQLKNRHRFHDTSIFRNQQI